MKEKRNGEERRGGMGRRLLLGVLGAVILAVVGVVGYAWVLKVRSDRVYETGKSINVFFKAYGSAIKSHDVDAMLDLYHDDYDNPSEGMWGETLLETGDEYLAGVSADIYEWSVEDPRHFKKSDVRVQLEGFNNKISEIESGKFKVEAIERASRRKAIVRVIWWMRGTVAEGEATHVESRATFRFWLQKNDDQWRITKKELLHGTLVRGAGVGFVDVAEESGIDFLAVHNRMLREDPDWKPTRFEIMQYAHGGVTASDYDGDGDDDLFFGDGLRPRLYRNKGDGTFEEVTAGAFAGQFDQDGNLPGSSVGLFLDLDNDGDEDLFVGRSTLPSKLFCNNGDGTFTEIRKDSPVPALAKDPGVSRPNAATRGEWVAVASAADFNNDGLVDLYVGRYLDPRENLPTTLFYTRNGEGNTLLMNNGDLTFSDVTEEMGVRDGGLTLGTAWGDYDNDGDADLYVANDFGRNAFFENQGPSGTLDANGNPVWNPFKEISRKNGTVDISYGMSATFADLDNDADLDLYVSNVHSGQRWFGNKATLQNYIANSMRQGEFVDDAAIFDQLGKLAEDKWALGDRVIRGNSLFRNDGAEGFSDITEESQVNPHGWYWGSLIFDFDNDGRQDIYATNGWISGEVADDL
ncbi:MAG: VCBS repeat-containing protein [Myxococcota bacterium]|nr:VCBS repeat-containing protein [Myxococcota bacterium]